MYDAYFYRESIAIHINNVHINIHSNIHPHFYLKAIISFFYIIITMFESILNKYTLIKLQRSPLPKKRI